MGKGRSRFVLLLGLFSSLSGRAVRMVATMMQASIWSFMHPSVHASRLATGTAPQDQIVANGTREWRRSKEKQKEVKEYGGRPAIGHAEREGRGRGRVGGGGGREREIERRRASHDGLGAPSRRFQGRPRQWLRRHLSVPAKSCRGASPCRRRKPVSTPAPTMCYKRAFHSVIFLLPLSPHHCSHSPAHHWTQHPPVISVGCE